MTTPEAMREAKVRLRRPQARRHPSETTVLRRNGYYHRRPVPQLPEADVSWWHVAGLTVFALALFLTVLYAAPILFVGLRGGR